MILTMVFLLYNKVLLRFIVAICGAGIAIATWQYLLLSKAKLGNQGIVDAFAIVSFLIAAWLIMLTAEVVDNHYVRAFACLCMLLGCVVSFRWIFIVDGPTLSALQGGQGGMQLVTLGFWVTALLSLGMLVLLVMRLVRDKQNAGRPPIPATQSENVLGKAPVSSASAGTELEPIPIDTSAPKLQSEGPGSGQVTTEERKPAPVSKLVAIGGLYLGSEYDLQAGTYTIGRADADILLERDNQVSRSHARIVVDATGMAVLSDAGSTNGTFLNNSKISEQGLAPGDVIRIGTTQFRAEGRS